MSFEQKTVLVTGASRGIGRAVADAFAARGAKVVGTATSEDGAVGIFERYSSGGGAGQLLDVSSDDSVASVFDWLEADDRLPQIVVNNAGVTNDNLLTRMKPEQWDAVIQTNLSSLYRICRRAARSMMKERYGRIVNIGSVVGSVGNAGQTNYAAAKAGMIGFTRSLARELGSRDVTVNAVSPGFIDTDMTRALPESQRQALLAQIPLKRLGDPADIAAAVLFLASDEAAYITGSTLHVNGGMYMG